MKEGYKALFLDLLLGSACNSVQFKCSPFQLSQWSPTQNGKLFTLFHFVLQTQHSIVKKD